LVDIRTFRRYRGDINEEMQDAGEPGQTLFLLWHLLLQRSACGELTTSHTFLETAGRPIAAVFQIWTAVAAKRSTAFLFGPDARG
jgi:hypothetical protein